VAEPLNNDGTIQELWQSHMMVSVCGPVLIVPLGSIETWGTFLRHSRGLPNHVLVLSARLTSIRDTRRLLRVRPTWNRCPVWIEVPSITLDTLRDTAFNGCTRSVVKCARQFWTGGDSRKHAEVIDRIFRCTCMVVWIAVMPGWGQNRLAEEEATR